MAAPASGSISAASTAEAPAFAAAMAASPLPAAKSSTRRPATSAGSSSSWRAIAWPPGQAKAQ